MSDATVDPKKERHPPGPVPGEAVGAGREGVNAADTWMPGTRPGMTF